MKDFLDQPLSEGDRVFTIGYGKCYFVAVVIGFTAQKVRVEFFDMPGKITIHSPDAVIKMSDSQFQQYIQSSERCEMLKRIQQINIKNAEIFGNVPSRIQVLS